MATWSGWSPPSRKSLARPAPDVVTAPVAQQRDALQRRLFDLGVAGLGLTVLSPLLAVIGLLIKLESPGPVLFIQKRVGRNQRLFNVIKLRSMRQAAAGQNTLPSIESIETFRFRPPHLEARLTVTGRVLRQT